MREFAGIGDEEQYASALPEDLAVPVVWPESAYAEELGKAQKRIESARRKERGVEFVSGGKT